jgi:ATP-dependent DNA helicase RecQ
VEELRRIIRKYWGYDDFRPLQAEAMQCVVEGRDSVVVLPTGGGKSLCFQAPAMQLDGLAVVVSPLISLMTDQVSALSDCGVPAASLSSVSTPEERRAAVADARSGKLKLLYLSPERLMTEWTLEFLQQLPMCCIAIDEAHCISDWGHDFRPEYRMLRRLKETFPGVGVHAYTATATEQVRQDIARELGLDSPQMLVGSFDRPNLVYRVQARSDRLKQIRDVIERHAGSSGIIYCIRRADVDEICAALKQAGVSALPYHAGLSDVARRKNQEAFLKDRAKIIVATVAFGMGIDKSDVRFVVHAGAPKSLEAYQQESGRAGRDGLEAECWLLYTPGDFSLWRRMQSELPEPALGIAQSVLAGIEGFCTSARCRHRAILEYFGEEFGVENCQACDLCLGEIALADDPLIVGQKILSCVVRLGQTFGGEYTAQVLVGSREQRILDNKHDQLSTYGLLSAHDKRTIRGWIEQLVGQQFLEKYGEYNVLQVTPTGRSLLRGEVAPTLLKAPERRPKRESKVAKESWEGVDRGLFEALRALRRAKADERGIPPFIVFGDASLRDMARRRPSSPQQLLEVHGVGERKSAEYGVDFLQLIADYCRRNDVALDAEADATRRKK